MIQIFFFLLLAFLPLRADFWVIDSEENPHLPAFENQTLFVSLGSHCLPARVLRVNQLRKVAFPFDWAISLDNQGLIQAIMDDFSFFLNEDYLIPDSVLIPRATGANLIHYIYHFEFAHEGDWRPSDYAKNFQSFNLRYQRRIGRFKALAHYPGTVIFLRCNYKHGLTDRHRYFKCSEIIDISDEDSLHLYEALKQRFPHLNFKLLILNEGEPLLNEIRVEKVLNEQLIKVRFGFQDEEKMYREYAQFFRSVGHF